MTMVSPLYISGEWIADVHAIYHGDKTFRKSEIYQNLKIFGSFPQTLWCCGELCRKACSPPQMWVQDRMSPAWLWLCMVPGCCLMQMLLCARALGSLCFGSSHKGVVSASPGELCCVHSVSDHTREELHRGPMVSKEF